jgi:hypothetical protein
VIRASPIIRSPCRGARHPHAGAPTATSPARVTGDGRDAPHPIGAAMPTLERQDSGFILDIGNKENRFHPDWIVGINAALDEVERAEGPAPW